MHQPLALMKFFLFILNNRAGPCFGEGGVTWEMASMMTSNGMEIFFLLFDY